MKHLYLYLCLIISFSVYSQNKQRKIDSLYVVVNKSKIDTAKINVYYNISQMYLHTDRNKMDSLSTLILKLSKKNNFGKGFGYYYFNLGCILVEQGKPKQAISKFYRANHYFYKLKNKSNYFESIYNIAFRYTDLNQSQKGKDIVIKALTLIKKTNYSKELSFLNFYLGTYYSEKNRDLKKGVDYYIQASYYANKIKNIQLIINCYSEIILIYFKQENWQKALYYATLSENYLEFIKKRNGNNNDYYYATIYSYLSKCNYFLTKYSVSLSQSKKAIEFAKKINDDSIIYFNLNLISANYFRLGNYALSLKYAKDNMSRYPDTESDNNVSQIIGKCYYKLHNYSKANSFLKTALKNDQDSTYFENYFGKFSLYKDLADVSEALKDYKSAYFYNKLYSDKKIPFLKLKFKNNTSELTERFHSKNLEIQNSILLENKKKKELEFNFQRREINLTYFILALFTILVIVLIIYNYKNKRTNLLLNSQKKQLEDSDLSIKKSLKQKELLLKEIHHRVKNNLQLIISLQNIQARRNINGNITDFLKKEQNRITAMALIHKCLYQNDTIETVDFKDYINNLIGYIQNSESENKINIVHSFHKLNFDLETSLPLGLIINELITNSYKHAFPNGTTGSIHIEIDALLENNYRLVYSDTGIPFPNEKVVVKSFGLELVALLAKQMRGTLLPLNKEKKEFTIIFKTINTD